MTKCLRPLLALTLASALLGLSPLSQAQSLIEGLYERVNPPQPTAIPDQVEVLEIFWYGCPHCNSFQPYIGPWQANKPAHVHFARMPAIFSPAWEIHAKAYYTSQAMGTLEQTHEQLFDAIHEQRRSINDEASLKAFFVEQGISEADFDKYFGSFGVESGVRRSKVMQQRYGIRGVPVVIVNGKYRVSGSLAGSYENVVKVIDALVEREHQAMLAKQQ